MLYNDKWIWPLIIVSLHKLKSIAFMILIHTCTGTQCICIYANCPDKHIKISMFCCLDYIQLTSFTASVNEASACNKYPWCDETWCKLPGICTEALCPDKLLQCLASILSICLSWLLYNMNLVSEFFLVCMFW